MIDIRELDFSYRGQGPESARAFGMKIDEFVVSKEANTAIVGPSGSGKTTLLSLIAGILRADSGSINVNGQQIAELSDKELGLFRIRNVGQVFQTFELLSYLTVIENVMLTWFISGRGRKIDVQTRAADLLRGVGLESKCDTRPGELSQGEQQRVAVCRAMLNNPSLLLADEPTGNLDQENKQNVVDLLVEQARANDSTLLMVTHDESLLSRFDSVIDMSRIARPVSEKS